MLFSLRKTFLVSLFLVIFLSPSLGTVYIPPGGGAEYLSDRFCRPLRGPDKWVNGLYGDIMYCEGGEIKEAKWRKTNEELCEGKPPGDIISLQTLSPIRCQGAEEQACSEARYSFDTALREARQKCETANMRGRKSYSGKISIFECAEEQRACEPSPGSGSQDKMCRAKAADGYNEFKRDVARLENKVKSLQKDFQEKLNDVKKKEEELAEGFSKKMTEADKSISASMESLQADHEELKTGEGAVLFNLNKELQQLYKQKANLKYTIESLNFKLLLGKMNLDQRCNQKAFDKIKKSKQDNVDYRKSSHTSEELFEIYSQVNVDDPYEQYGGEYKRFRDECKRKISVPEYEETTAIQKNLKEAQEKLNKVKERISQLGVENSDKKKSLPRELKAVVERLFALNVDAIRKFGQFSADYGSRVTSENGWRGSLRMVLSVHGESLFREQANLSLKKGQLQIRGAIFEREVNFGLKPTPKGSYSEAVTALENIRAPAGKVKNTCCKKEDVGYATYGACRAVKSALCDLDGTPCRPSLPWKSVAPPSSSPSGTSRGVQ